MEDDFEKWVSAWAAAEQEIAQERQTKEPEPEPPSRTSYFSGSPSDQDYHDSEDGQADDWNNLYSRAMEIDFSQPDTLITDGVNVAYAGEEGYGKQTIPPLGKSPTPGGKKVYTNQPIHFASAGEDQEGDDGHVRVTNNWNQGKELEELSDIKTRLEAMERRAHSSDVLKKKDFGSLKTQLEGMRKRVKQLSEKLTSTPQNDLT